MKFNRKNSPIDDQLLFPAYGNTIGWMAILLGLLLVVQSVFSWHIVGKEVSGYIFKCALLIGLGFFVISKNMLNLRAGLPGRLGALMGSVMYGIGIVIINPIISYLLSDGFSTSLEPAEVIINICIFYFILLFIRRKPQSVEPAAENAEAENQR
jgi:hypothetical protein